jgi:hypothetical protein
MAQLTVRQRYRIDYQVPRREPQLMTDLTYRDGEDLMVGTCQRSGRAGAAAPPLRVPRGAE